jgi:hypothetical protein
MPTYVKIKTDLRKLHNICFDSYHNCFTLHNSEWNKEQMK